MEQGGRPLTRGSHAGWPLLASHLSQLEFDSQPHNPDIGVYSDSESGSVLSIDSHYSKL